ncbi:MAG: peptidylprolyl isomerase [Sphingomonas fennica]
MLHRALPRRLILIALLLAPGTAWSAALPQVRLETSAGPIVIELEARKAPITTANFLAYVSEKRFDGTTFYRAARSRTNPSTGLVQGGINHQMRNARPAIAHEPTSRTGLAHVDGTVSMARNDPGTAMGDFFIIVGKNSTYLDARPGSPGYAAFGHVVSGMPIVRRMLAMPTFPGGWSRTTIGQSLRQPVRILSARRIR